MIRHFYITENLAELVDVEHELEQKGISESQIHVLSEQDAEVSAHQLPQVESILKKDLTVKRTLNFDNFYKEAPAEIPIIEGSANGFLKSPCIAAPLIPITAPTIRLNNNLGRRIPQMMASDLISGAVVESPNL